MVLARRKIGVTIGLLSAALIGLVAVQAYLLHVAVQLRERIFSHSVHAALTVVPRRLEAGEAVERVRRWVRVSGADSLHLAAEAASLGVPAALERLRAATGSGNLRVDGDVRSYVMIGDSVAAGGAGGRMVIQCAGLAASDTLPGVYLRFEGRPPAGAEALASEARFLRRDLLERIVIDLMAVEPKAFVDRVDLARLDSTLAAGFREAGINLPYAFGLMRVDNDSLVAISAERYREDVQRSHYRASLFPLELTPPFHALAVHFPRVRTHLWLQIWPLLAASLVFTLAVVYCFGQAVRTIGEQRRLAARIVDFINNMTHEFKTPISTIALASEAIGRREVQSDPVTVQRYNQMIGDENRRMRGQVERILQMAQLERGGIALALETVDLHESIRRTLDGFALQIEQRRGTVVRDLGAARATVRGDAVHLAGVIGNLIDNAIKYSPGSPEIEVRSREESGWLIVTVADHGAGIPEQHRARVFEKYFRCPTGERHDVKGFGLGLSYVKLLVEAHGGRIALDSREGEGTRVTVRLPLAGPPAGDGA